MHTSRCPSMPAPVRSLLSSIATLVALSVAAPIMATPPAAAAPTSPLERSIATLTEAQTHRVTVQRRSAEVAQFVDELGRAGVVFRADWPALERLGIDKDDRVEFEATDLTVLDAAVAFALALGDESDRPVIDAAPGQLVLTTEHALARMREAAIYDVADIVTNETLLAESSESAPLAVDASTDEDRAIRLVALILDHVDSQSWLENGGSRGRISQEAGRLIVSASPATHARLRRFLADMRREAPTSAAVEVRLLSLPSERAQQLATAAGGDPHALARAARAAREATTLWSPRVIAQLGEPARIETSSDAGSLTASVTPHRDRSANVLSMSLTFDATVAGTRGRYEGTLAFEPGEEPVAILMPQPASNGTATASWILIVQAAALNRRTAEARSAAQ